MLMRSRSVSSPTNHGSLPLLLLVAALLASPALCAQAPSAAAALAAVDAPALARITGAIRPGVPMQLNLALAGASLRLDLQPLSYRTPDFKLEVIEDGQPRFVDPGPVRTVRGTIAGLRGARVLGVVKPSGLELLITLANGKLLEVKPLAEKGEKAGRGLYSVVPRGRAERAGAVGGLESVTDDPAFTKSTGDNCANLGRCGATIVFDTDSIFYSFNGSSSEGVMASVEQILAFVNNKFDILKIRHALAGVRVRPDTASDPYDDVPISSGGQLRTLIQDEWAGDPIGQSSDLVHLLTGVSPPNGGQSPTPGICSSNSKYSYSRDLGVFCQEAALTTHELGHSWGSIHTASGIMANATVSCTATWDAQATAAIEAERDLIDGICLDLIPQKRASISFVGLPSTMTGGQQVAVTAKVKNTGVLTWSPVGPSLGAYRLAQVGSTAWSPNRVDLAAPLNALSEVTLTFNVTAPSTPGVHNFQLQMVHENVEFFGDASASVPVTVLVKDATISQPTVSTTMVAGQTYPVSITVQNTGNVSWSPIGPSCNAYRLGSVGSAGFNPVRVELPTALSPGNQVTLNFNVTAPASPGTYTFQWRMVHECVEWFGSQSPAVSVTVTP